ncbi:hypothetical protein [Sedimentibacter sp.]|uniref:hypothetical protein n=1 Tax=Sedimentibacter sp. TaxID=1960295 RepID=UPI0028AAE409|nr:hypothetical protein [Sedimentibacter sp.]
MKKAILIFIILFLLTSCGNNQIGPEALNEPEAAPEKETSIEVNNEEQEKEASKKAEEEIKKVSSLKDFTLEQSEEIKITEKDGGRILIDDYLSSVEIVSDTAATFSDSNYETVRYSSNALYCDGFDDGYGKDLIKENISEMKFMTFDDFSSPYNITKHNTNLIFDFNESQYNIKDIIYGYSAENITLNCFARRVSTSIFDVIVDPAYMYGLPVYHSNSSSGEYTINGLKIKSDTINFTVSISNVAESSKESFGVILSKGLDHGKLSARLNKLIARI